MPFSDDFVTIHGCNTVAGTGDPGGTITAGRGNATDIAVSTGNGDYIAKEGADCVEWGGSTANQINSVYFPTGGIDMTGKHLWFWFFYAKGKGGAYIDPTDSLQIRLHSSPTWSATPTNYVDFFLAGEVDIPSAWSLHCVSGDADDADASAGTFNPANVTFIEVAVDQAAANGSGNTGTNRFALDYFRIGSGVTITGAETSATLEAAYGIGTEHGVWEPLAALGGAVVNKLCKITVGDGSAAAGFQLQGLVVYDNQKSDDAKFGWAVNGSGAGVSRLQLGEKISGPGFSFGSSGCQLIAAPRGVSDFNRPDIEVIGNNGQFWCFGTLIKGFDQVQIGNVGTDPNLDCIDTEFDNCNAVIFETTDGELSRGKIHDCAAANAALTVRKSPALLEQISIYNNAGDGISFEGIIVFAGIGQLDLIANDDGAVFDRSGTYDVKSWKFSANTTDIYLDSTTAALVLQAGGAQPPVTSRTNGGTASVDIQTGATLTITNIPAGGILTIYNNDDQPDDPNDLGSTAQTTNPTTGADVAFIHAGVVDDVWIQFVATGFVEVNVLFDLGVADQSLDLSQFLEVETNL